MLHSYELMARHVMPHFQGSADAMIASNQWAYERHETLQAGPNARAGPGAGRLCRPERLAGRVREQRPAGSNVGRRLHVP